MAGGSFTGRFDMPQTLPQFQHHPRDWRANYYVYPVISRRSRGLSIGVNLNPDTACNFDCIYCQVDRTVVPRVRDVDPQRLRVELKEMLRLATSGELFQDPAFAEVPGDLQRINDIAFSGDGEPTTCPLFAECVQIAAECKSAAGLENAKIILITDACYLTRPSVARGLRILDENNGEIWAKLDAGTEEYYRVVNRPNYPLKHVVEQISAAARVRPVVIQALFLRLDGEPPPRAELDAFCDRLLEVIAGGGRISLVQIYTVARRPAESYVTALSDEQVDAIAETVTSRTRLPVERYYGA